MSVFDFGVKRPEDFSPMTDEILEKTTVWQFEQIVEKYPDRMALKDATQSLNYRELNNACNNLAQQIIQELGSGKSPVAFLLGNEILSIIAFMAILKSGRPYLGLHSGNSNEQLKSYLEDSTAPLLITTSQFKETAGNIIGDQRAVKVLYFDDIKSNIFCKNPETPTDPEKTFAIFYTSGSTGKPKGVAVGHLCKAQTIQYMTNGWFYAPSDHIAMLTSVCYGAAYPSVLGALMNGALLCILDLKTNAAQQTLDWIVNEELTVFRCTPSIFRTVFGLAPEGMIFSKLRFITLGGEPVTDGDIELFKAHTADDCVLINNFAATEAWNISHFVVRHDFPPFSGFLPAGFPAPGKEILLVDDDGQSIQDEREGEIVIRSRYLSQGYWRQPELTTQKFHADPNEPGVRLYYSGDRGRWVKDGALEVMGRKDNQVKVRGYRIQLEVIDLALRNLEGVSDAATIVFHSSGRGERLVAYLAMQGRERRAASQLRKSLSAQLADYMIPSVFIQMDMLPRTVTGKLARLQLPDPSHERPELETPFAAPQGEVELQIASIWKKSLELEKVGRDDSFFELGGDSLSAVEMTLEVEKLFSKPVPPAFFKKPSISSLSALLETGIHTERPKEKFVVESFKKDKNSSAQKKSKRSIWKNLQSLTSRKYSLEDLDKVLDLLVARYIVSKPYTEANQWAIQWSKNPFVRDVLYRRRYALLSRWMASLNNCSVPPAEAFQLSLITNLSFGLSKYLGKKEKSVKEDLRAYKKSKYAYWRTLGEVLDATPVGQLNEYFPIGGIEHFSRAYEQGKGVILLTFHGVPTPGRFFAFERFMKLDDIPTISYHIPVWQSEYHNREHEMPESVASTLNAEIALYGQRKLQAGQVINLASDTNDLQGRTYNIPIAGKIYQLKSGFAELALNSGAKIIPHFRHCLADGKIQLSFGPPLDPGHGDRNQQVETLLNSYAAFIENTWATHPEAMRWTKIRKHLARQSSR